MSKFYRIGFYLLGNIILAIGITLNTKTGMGVSPIISIPYTISNIWNINFGFITFVVYSVFVVVQFILKGKKREFRDLLQIPYGFAFGMFLNVFSAIMDIKYSTLWQQFIILAAAIIVTAIGAAMMVNMHFIPNPADGLAQAIGTKIHKDMGLGKNIVDCFSVVSSLIIALVAVGSPLAFGIGTIGAMIGVGRCIALFNLLFKDKMCNLAGMQTA